VRKDDKPVANSFVLLREEFDDWAILFNPDSGEGFGLSPTGVYAWKLLDGEHTIVDMLNEIHALAEDVPAEAEDHIKVFVETLVAEGLAGYEGSRYSLRCGLDRAEPHRRELCSLAGHAGEAAAFKYEQPVLVDFGIQRQEAQGAICSSGYTAMTGCASGACPTRCGNGSHDCDCNHGSQATGGGLGCDCGYSPNLKTTCSWCNVGNFAGYCNSGTGG
jgi:SynChlorMet cassette protein ScmD